MGVIGCKQRTHPIKKQRGKLVLFIEEGYLYLEPAEFN